MKDRSSQEAYTKKQKLLRLKYGDRRKEWEGSRDDRRVFCNIYDMEMEACEVMKQIENITVCVGFNEKYMEDLKTLAEIDSAFRNRGK